MIEKIIYDFLNTLDLSASVYTEMPKDVPSKLFLIERTGGNITDHIKMANIAIKSYADTLYDAIVLNEEIKQAMLEDLIKLDDISGVKLNSDYNFTDTTTKRYRYQAVFVVTYY